MTSAAKDPAGVTLSLITTWLEAARQPVTPVTISVLAGALLADANGSPAAAIAKLRNVRMLLELAAVDQAQSVRAMADRKVG